MTVRRNQFVDQVQERLGLASREEAERTVDAVLETLGERLELTEKHHLASQVAADLKEPILRRKRTERYDLEEFFNRVGARAGGLKYAHAQNHTKVVLSLLRAAIAPGEWRHITMKLPEDYRSLLRGDSSD
ncbi:MAG: DUF2267 domain-containing protein [Anaerolineae bacterium]|nr:DUF2267 domain-containing protein [Anaerolineae bacterium]